MAESTGRTDNHAATLAAALSARIGVLADAARDTMIAIERDRSALEGRYGSSVMADELISAVRGRIEGVAGDCNDLAVILDRFKSLAGPSEVTEEVTGSHAIPAPPPPRPITGLPAVPTGPELAGDSGRVISDGVRLLATQMSVAGANPDEIALRLREDFGVADADALVDELFGIASHTDDPEEDYHDDRGSFEEPSGGSLGPPGAT